MSAILIPPWADETVSKKIPEWRSREEGQTIEFKEDFPDQGHKLAQEIAAFATAGKGGVILLGVFDNGKVNGLNAADRDGQIHRAQGIANMGVTRIPLGRGFAM